MERKEKRSWENGNVFPPRGNHFYRKKEENNQREEEMHTGPGEKITVQEVNLKGERKKNQRD